MTRLSILSKHLINSAAPNRLAADGQENVSNVESPAPETLNLVNHFESRIPLCLDCIDIASHWHYLPRKYRFQDHIDYEIHLCLHSNVNHDHCCLVVLHHHDRNWPVSKAGLLQALNDDRLCVRTSEKDSFIISIFSNLFFKLTFDLSTTSIGDKTFATKSPSKD